MTTVHDPEPTSAVRAQPAAAPVAAPTLDIVVPVYNEAHVLDANVERLAAHLRTTMPFSWQITIVDNGSTDSTVAVATELAARYPQVRIDSLGRPNYGAAMKAGILRARGEFVICDEIDLCDVDFYQRALGLLSAGEAEMVVGSKAMSGANDRRPLLRRAATLTINGMLRVLVGFHGTDTHGLKAFRRENLLGTVQRCIVDKDLFASEFVIRAEREGRRLREIPVHIAEKRPPSINLVKRVPNVLKNLAKLTYIIRIKG